MKISEAAGKPADPSILVNVPKLVTAYYELRPDPADPRQRVVFGTSGHRGSAFEVAFNEWHILAITRRFATSAWRRKSKDRYSLAWTPTRSPSQHLPAH